LRARYVYLKSRGPEAYARVLECARPELRELVEAGFLETRWYPYEIMVELTETIDRVLGNGDGSIAYELGRFSCDQNLTTVMRLLFKFGNLGFLLDRVAKAWGNHYDEGRMIIPRRVVGEEVVVELHDHPYPNRVQCLAIKGWMVRASELSGEDGVECTELCRVAGDEICRWTFRWQSFTSPG
jgi:hypothetical protein